jgi:hypothetical protein
MVVHPNVGECLLEIGDVVVRRRKLLRARSELQPRNALDEQPEVLRPVQIAVEHETLQEILVVTEVGRDTEAWVAHVLEPLAELAAEAQVRLGIVGVQGDVLDRVERVGPIPRVREVRV